MNKSQVHGWDIGKTLANFRTKRWQTVIVSPCVKNRLKIPLYVQWVTWYGVSLAVWGNQLDEVDMAVI